ncbi:MAG: BCCT family transporter [Gracilimonas sp.]|nr:BCCT family transporter [Gracilimonas sp.]
MDLPVAVNWMPRSDNEFSGLRQRDLLQQYLLIGGGLTALQTASISTGLPFALILLVMCYSLHQGLKREYRENQQRVKDKDRDSYKELVEEAIKNQQKDKDQ